MNVQQEARVIKGLGLSLGTPNSSLLRNSARESVTWQIRATGLHPGLPRPALHTHLPAAPAAGSRSVSLHLALQEDEQWRRITELQWAQEACRRRKEIGSLGHPVGEGSAGA